MITLIKWNERVVKELMIKQRRRFNVNLKYTVLYTEDNVVQVNGYYNTLDEANKIAEKIKVNHDIKSADDSIDIVEIDVDKVESDNLTPLEYLDMHDVTEESETIANITVNKGSGDYWSWGKMKDVRVKHHLKILSEYFEAVISEDKTFEIRKNDRRFEVGDKIRLKEWNNGAFTGRQVHGVITYITDYAQQDDYVVFSFSRLLNHSKC